MRNTAATQNVRHGKVDAVCAMQLVQFRRRYRRPRPHVEPGGLDASPSLDAFRTVLTDHGRLEAQKNHRKQAIADTHTLVVRPSINRLRESVG